MAWLSDSLTIEGLGIARICSGQSGEDVAAAIVNGAKLSRESGGTI